MLFRILILLIIPLPLLANDGTEAVVVGLIVGGLTAIILGILRWTSENKPSLKKIIKPIESSLDNKNKINKLKTKLEAIELQITSYQEIKKTGKMSDEEENSWVELTREHKKTTDDIRKLLTTYNSKDLTGNEDVETQEFDDTTSQDKTIDDIPKYLGGIELENENTSSEQEIDDNSGRNQILYFFIILILFCVTFILSNC